MTGLDVLLASRTVVVIDWPSRDVPDALARAGLRVLVKSGPGPADYSLQELVQGEVVPRRIDRAPQSADLVYAYRPLAELPDIVNLASSISARTVWWQSGIAADGSRDLKGCWLPPEQMQKLQQAVQEAGMAFLAEDYIADVARRVAC